MMCHLGCPYCYILLHLIGIIWQIGLGGAVKPYRFQKATLHTYLNFKTSLTSAIEKVRLDGPPCRLRREM